MLWWSSRMTWGKHFFLCVSYFYNVCGNSLHCDFQLCSICGTLHSVDQVWQQTLLCWGNIVWIVKFFKLNLFSLRSIWTSNWQISVSLIQRNIRTWWGLVKCVVYRLGSVVWVCTIFKPHNQSIDWKEN